MKYLNKVKIIGEVVFGKSYNVSKDSTGIAVSCKSMAERKNDSDNESFYDYYWITFYGKQAKKLDGGKFNNHLVYIEGWLKQTSLTRSEIIGSKIKCLGRADGFQCSSSNRLLRAFMRFFYEFKVLAKCWLPQKLKEDNWVRNETLIQEASFNRHSDVVVSCSEGPICIIDPELPF